MEPGIDAGDSAPVITLFSRSVLSSLAKKAVPTLFQWSKGALVDLFLESVLDSERLKSEANALSVLENCQLYLKENLAPEILKRLLKGVNIYAEDDEEDEATFLSRFLIFLPFGNSHIKELDLSSPSIKPLSPFDITVIKTLLSSCENLTSLTIPKIATDEILKHVEVTCPHLRYLEVKYSDVTDVGVCALGDMGSWLDRVLFRSRCCHSKGAIQERISREYDGVGTVELGFDVHEEGLMFRRTREGLNELRYLGLMGVCAIRKPTFDSQNGGVSVDAMAVVLAALPNLKVLTYPRLSETILSCKNTNAAATLPLDHYVGPFSLDRAELLAEYLPNLTRIDVNLNLVEEESMVHFQHMKHLIDLRIGVQSFSSSCLDQLAVLDGQLESFFITCLQLKSSDLSSLRSRLPGIKQLSLAYSKFEEDAPFSSDSGWENLSELEIRSEKTFFWPIPGFCTGNSKQVNTLFFRAPLDQLSKEEDLGNLLSNDRFKNLECLFLRVPKLPVSALVCVAMALCPSLKQVGNMDTWGIKGPFMTLLEDHLEKNNVELELMTTYHEGLFYNLNSKRRQF